MSKRDRIDVHAGRALEELDCARSAITEAAALAHLALSELHMTRMREISREMPGPTLRVVQSDAERPAESATDTTGTVARERVHS